MVDAALFSSARADWETPKDLFARLSACRGGYVLDAAASHKNHLAPFYFTEAGFFVDSVAFGIEGLDSADGLTGEWAGSGWTFCNPPYGRGVTGLWVRKAHREATQGHPSDLLLPARTDTAWFHDYINNREDVGIEFIRGRLAFALNGEPALDKKGNVMKAPFPSMVVSFYA